MDIGRRRFIAGSISAILCKAADCADIGYLGMGAGILSKGPTILYDMRRDDLGRIVRTNFRSDDPILGKYVSRKIDLREDLCGLLEECYVSGISLEKTREKLKFLCLTSELKREANLVRHKGVFAVLGKKNVGDIGYVCTMCFPTILPDGSKGVKKTDIMAVLDEKWKDSENQLCSDEYERQLREFELTHPWWKVMKS